MTLQFRFKRCFATESTEIASFGSDLPFRVKTKQNKKKLELIQEGLQTRGHTPMRPGRPLCVSGDHYGCHRRPLCVSGDHYVRLRRPLCVSGDHYVRLRRSLCVSDDHYDCLRRPSCVPGDHRGSQAIIKVVSGDPWSPETFRQFGAA